MVKVGVHQGLVQSFIVHCPHELLYAIDLVLIAESMKELIKKFNNLKNGMETQGTSEKYDEDKSNGK